VAKGPHRVTLAEREAEIERHPETDTRPRYGDGTRALPGDVVRHGGVLVRVAWHNRTQEVPQVAYEAVLAGGAGTVPLKDLRLEERTTP
jgi:hypothetical protein